MQAYAQLLTPTSLVIIFSFIAVVALVIVLRWKLQKKKTSKAKKSSLLVFDTNGTFGELPDADKPAFKGTPWYWQEKGGWVEIFERVMKGDKVEIVPFNLTAKIIGAEAAKKKSSFAGKQTVAPDALHQALRWPSLKIMFKFDNGLMDKINMWLGVALVGILLLFLFLVLSSVKG